MRQLVRHCDIGDASGRRSPVPLDDHFCHNGASISIPVDANSGRRLADFIPYRVDQQVRDAAMNDHLLG